MITSNKMATKEYWKKENYWLNRIFYLSYETETKNDII